MSIGSLKPYLEYMTTSTYGEDSLPKKLKIAGLKGVPSRKASMVSALDEFLRDERNIRRIWNNMSSYEKDIMEEYVRSGKSLDSGDIEAIMEKHGKNDDVYSIRYLVDCFNEHSQVRLFFLFHSIPEPIYNVLKGYVKPVEIKFMPVAKPPEEDIDVELIIRESFEKDFVNILRLINSSKLKTTKGSGLPTKAAVIKVSQVLENKEIITEDFGDIEDIRVIEQTNRIHGIFQLMLTYDTVVEKDGILELDTKTNEFLKLSHVDKCSELLKAYIESGQINEIERMREIKVNIYNKEPYFKICREVILKYLSLCPVDEWIDMIEFARAVKRNDRNFLTKVTGSIDSYDYYYRYYTDRTQEWEEFEGRFIDIMFIEYLSALGIVDVELTEGYGEYSDISYFMVLYFRLTPMGAYVLGITDDYNFEGKKGSEGFIIQPNYEILVPEGRMKDAHTMFFERFAEKVSEDKVSIYKLTFKSIVTALDNGIKVEEITDYLKENCENNIPENVLSALQEWERESKRIKIRTVTIVETDDKYLMEELKSYKSINNKIKDELPYVFEIDSSDINKVKREVEKKNHFCLLE